MIENFLFNSEKKKKKISVWKISKKTLIYGIIIFFVITSLWGCSQQIFNNTLLQYSNPGSGFEIIKNLNNSPNHHTIVNGSEISFRYINTFKNAIALGPFFGLFVWPLANLVIIFFNFLHTQNNSYYGNSFSAIFTIFLIVIFIRFCLSFLSFKQFKQQIKMQQIQPKIAQIKSKYQGMSDLASKQMMQKEIFAINKSVGLNPIESFGINFITLPFFYAMYRVFSSLRLYKNNWIIHTEYKYIYSTYTAISHHRYWIYLVFALILIPIQIGSIKVPSYLAQKANKKIILDEAGIKNQKRNKLILNVMTLFTALISFVVPLSVVFYLMFSGTYTIFQAIIINNINNRIKTNKISIFEQKALSKKKNKIIKSLKLVQPKVINIAYFYY